MITTLLTGIAGWLIGNMLLVLVVGGIVVYELAAARVRARNTPEPEPVSDPTPEPEPEPVKRAREVTVCDRDGGVTSRVTALQPAEVSEMLLTALELEGRRRLQAEREGRSA